MAHKEYELSELTGKVIGCAMEVHNIIGCGYMEKIYQRALARELDLNSIQAVREMEMDIRYKGLNVGKRRVDFFVENILMVEIKAVSKLENVHLAQAINYLEMYGSRIGLLINFGSTSLEFKRVTNNKIE